MNICDCIPVPDVLCTSTVCYTRCMQCKDWAAVYKGYCKLPQSTRDTQSKHSMNTTQTTTNMSAYTPTY